MMHGYLFMGFGMGLLWLIAALVVAYLIYKLIKSEKILVPSGQLSEVPRIFWLNGMQRGS